MIQFTAVVAVFALVAAACAADPSDVGGGSGGEGSASGETLDEACREFSTAWGQEDFDGAAAALRDMASAMATAFPEEASLTTEVVAALADGGERALARLEPVIPILGSEECATVQEIVSVYVAAPAPEPGDVAADLAEQILADLRQAEALWEAAGVVSYRLRVEVGCFCPEEYRGPFSVVVQDGVVEATRNGEDLAEFAPTSYFTVPGLFDAVERFAYSDAITVTYDPDYGFPMIIDADPAANTIDEEQRILVTDFTIDG